MLQLSDSIHEEQAGAEIGPVRRKGRQQDTTKSTCSTTASSTSAANALRVAPQGACIFRLRNHRPQRTVEMNVSGVQEIRMGTVPVNS